MLNDFLSLLIGENSIIHAIRVVFGLFFILGIAAWFYNRFDILPPGFSSSKGEGDKTKDSYNDKDKNRKAKKGFFIMILSAVFFLATFIPFGQFIETERKKDRYIDINELYEHPESNFKFHLKSLYPGGKLSFKYMLPNAEWENDVGICGEIRFKFVHDHKSYLFEIIECLYYQDKVLFHISTSSQ